MKKFIVILLGLFLIGCTKPEEVSINRSLSEFVGTRAEAPLESTIWEYNTGEEFNRYIVFKDEQASLFYGAIEDSSLHRYSEFYSAPYTFENNKLVTSIVYPLWGTDVKTESVSMIEAGDEFTLLIDGLVYKFLTTDISMIKDRWMIIYVGIRPWQ